jgi:hypothetical protein
MMPVLSPRIDNIFDSGKRLVWLEDSVKPNNTVMSYCSVGCSVASRE